MNTYYGDKPKDGYNDIHYGQDDNEFFVDIQAKVDELQMTWDNRKKFKHIMKNLEREVMGGYISDEEDVNVAKPENIKSISGGVIEKPRPMNTPSEQFKQSMRGGQYGTYGAYGATNLYGNVGVTGVNNLGNMGNMGNISNLNTLNNLNLINNQPGIHSGPFVKPIMPNLINPNTGGHYPVTNNHHHYDRSQSPGVSRNKKTNKKYTDVHANSKYYYPTEMNSSYDDLNVEQSQWNDRSNRNALYNQYSNIPPYESRRNNRSFYEDEILRDNSNSRYYI
jgi:hypothetical protein